jgi:hypothetical protein
MEKAHNAHDAKAFAALFAQVARVARIHRELARHAKIEPTRRAKGAE